MKVFKVEGNGLGLGLGLGLVVYCMCVNSIFIESLNLIEFRPIDSFIGRVVSGNTEHRRSEDRFWERE